jgi:hypothetical protein
MAAPGDQQSPGTESGVQADSSVALKVTPLTSTLSRPYGWWSMVVGGHLWLASDALETPRRSSIAAGDPGLGAVYLACGKISAWVALNAGPPVFADAGVPLPPPMAADPVAATRTTGPDVPGRLQFRSSVFRPAQIHPADAWIGHT